MRPDRLPCDRRFIRVAIALRRQERRAFQAALGQCERLGLRTEYALGGIGILTGFIDADRIAGLWSVPGVVAVELAAEDAPVTLH